MRITAIEVKDNGARLREVELHTYIVPNDYAEVIALRGKLKGVVRTVPLTNLKYWWGGH